MKSTNKRYLFLSFLLLIVSIAATYFYISKGYKTVEPSTLNRVVREITVSYRRHQVIATLIMYAVGFFCAYPFCIDIGKEWVYLLAMPIGNALWGTISAFVLFFNIPYNRYVMLLIIFFLVISLLLKFRENYKGIEWEKVFACHMVVLAIILMASSGIFAKFTSSDSYYFVMQYGELIAKHGRLSSDIVGTYMTWTGITPALTSAYAAMWGFENIYVIHYLLIFSMYGFIMLLVYKRALIYYSKKVSLSVSVAALITVGVIPGVSYLSFWIISNTYFMVYIIFMLLLPMVSGRKFDYKVTCLILPFTVWLTLCRPETTLVMCFFIICMSSLGISKKQVIVLYSSICIAWLMFLGKLIYEYSIGARQASEKMLTTKTVTVLLLALIITAIYVIYYNSKWICFIRKKLNLFVFGGLIISCLGLGVLDIDKFLTNLNVVRCNLCDWYWKYVPITIIVIEIMKSCYKCRKNYYDLIVWGFILCNFAVCMGRPHPLRLGIGDSYNRICMSIVPLYVVTTILEFLDRLGVEREGM